MKDTGGPAFPAVGEVYGKEDDTRWTPGMTLRDYFAGQAMLGVLASPTATMNMDTKEIVDKIAPGCYALADAMLKERKR